MQLLRARIEQLEHILQIQQSSMSEDTSAHPPIQPSSSTSQSYQEAGTDPVSFMVDDITANFEGALCLDESLNFDQDGEARYFGATSGRLDFQSGEITPLLV